MEPLTANTWERVLGKLQGKVNPHSYSTWFKPTSLMSEDGESLRVRVPNAWFAEWLRTNYLALILDTLRELQRSGLAVQFVVPEREPAPAPAAAPPVIPAPSIDRGTPALNPARNEGWSTSDRIR